MKILTTIRLKLCKLGFHKLMAYYDPEYSRNGECYFCYHCDAQFDEQEKRI